MTLPNRLYGDAVLALQHGRLTIRRSRVGYTTCPFDYLEMARRLYDAAQSSIWRCRVGSTTRPFDYSKMPICLHGHGCLTMWRSRVGSTTRLFDYLEKPCWLYNTAVRLFGDASVPIWPSPTAYLGALLCPYNVACCLNGGTDLPLSGLLLPIWGFFFDSTRVPFDYLQGLDCLYPLSWTAAAPSSFKNQPPSYITLKSAAKQQQQQQQQSQQ